MIARIFYLAQEVSVQVRIFSSGILEALMKQKQNVFDRFVGWLNTVQQKNRFFAFSYAVMKKYDDDKSNYLAALIAYFGFLSLFPLLIVLTAVLQKIATNNLEFQTQIINSVTSFFPALGSSIAESIQSPSKAGLALIVGLLVMLYGARGVTDAVQNALNHAWMVERHRRSGFPKSTIKSFGMMFAGGLCLLAAATATGLATAKDQLLLPRIGYGVVGLLLLYVVFWGLFTFGSSARHTLRSNIDGALFATIGFLGLQLLGSYIINHQLRTQTGLNAQLATIIALLFWLYLQARIFLYAVQINAVRYYKLHPRSIQNKPPTKADLRAYDLYKNRETFLDPEVLKHS